MSVPGASDSKFVTGGCATYHSNAIKAHWTSRTHLRACERMDRAGERPGPLDVVIQQMQEKHVHIMIHLFNTAYFVLKSELQFTSFTSLLQLQVKNGSDLKELISYQSDQACRRFSAPISDVLREAPVSLLQNARVIGIAFYGATDSSVCEVEVVYFRALENGEPRTFYCSLEEVKHAHADGVFGAISQAFEKRDCPDWLQKVVGVGCDGAHVNIGANNSVCTRLRGGREYVLRVHCVCHRTELSISDSMKNNENLRTVSDILRKVYKHYKYSPKAVRELAQIGEALEEKPLKPTRADGTHWTPHMSKALDILMRKWHLLLAHFEHVSQAAPGQATAEVRGQPHYLSTKIKKYKILRFMAFMQDLVSVIIRLSLELQRDSLTPAGYNGFSGMLHAGYAGTASCTGWAPNKIWRWRQPWRSVSWSSTHRCWHRSAWRALPRCSAVGHRSHHKQVGARQQSAGWRAMRIFDVRDWAVQNRADLAVYGNNLLPILINQFGPVLARMGCDTAEVPGEWRMMKAHFGNLIRGGQGLATIRINQLFRDAEQADWFKNLLMLLEITRYSSFFCYVWEGLLCCEAN